MYRIETEEFSGPLEKLLELIEGKKMDVTQVSLAAVTADFLRYVEELRSAVRDTTEGADTPQRREAQVLADFLVVAAHLILIKSKALLPSLELSGEEEAGVYDLERRLSLYRDIRPLFTEFKELWSAGGQAFSRSSSSQFQPIFYPPRDIGSAELERAFVKVAQVLEQFLIERDTVERQLISLESKIEEVSEKVTRGTFRFSELANTQSREEVIVFFLAVLHLLRDRIVHARQDDLFGDITVESSHYERTD